jgi:hypothetical protein
MPRDRCYYFKNIFGKTFAFYAPTTAIFLMILTLVFEKNANFFAENWQKSQKIAVITSTPGCMIQPGCGLCNIATSVQELYVGHLRLEADPL